MNSFVLICFMAEDKIIVRRLEVVMKEGGSAAVIQQLKTVK